MTSDNENVSRQMPWAGNIAKTMTSNGKQFTVTREMLTAVARDQSVQLKMAWCCRKNLTPFFKICFCFVLLYNKSLNDWSLGKQWILFPSGPVIKCLLLTTIIIIKNDINKKKYSKLSALWGTVHNTVFFHHTVTDQNLVEFMMSSPDWFAYQKLEYLWNKKVLFLKIVNSILLLVQTTCLCFKMA